MTNPLSLNCLKHLNDASAYLCFVRFWWDGAGIDTVFLWKDTIGCRQRILVTGETSSAKEPTMVLDKIITEQQFNALLNEFASLGIGSLPSQNRRIAYTHYDDWYGIKHEGQQSGHWVKVAGGKHEHKGWELCDFILLHFPVFKATNK